MVVWVYVWVGSSLYVLVLRMFHRSVSHHRPFSSVSTSKCVRAYSCVCAYTAHMNASSHKENVQTRIRCVVCIECGTMLYIFLSPPRRAPPPPPFSLYFYLCPCLFPLSLSSLFLLRGILLALSLPFAYSLLGVSVSSSRDIT